MKSFDRLHIRVLIMLFLISLLFMCGEGLDLLKEKSGINWSDFAYRRAITITENSGSTLSDFQIKITLDGLSSIFTNSQANGEDIRFNYNGDSIPYYIENWSQVGETATVWVKVPSIPATGLVIYMYYGDSTRTAASSFSDTFTKTFNQPGLVGEWHMDGSTNDSSGYGNNGTNNGASWNGYDGGYWGSTAVSFPSGDSLYFDGSDYVSVSDDNSLDVNYITIEAWIKTTANASDLAGTHYIVSKWDGVNQCSYSLDIIDSVIYFATTNGGAVGSAHNMNRGSLSTNSTYHIVATSNGAVKSIYINGSLSGGTSDTWALTIFAGTSDLIFGDMEGSDNGNEFTGTIDEIKIYNTALTANEVLGHYERRNTTAGPDSSNDPTTAVGTEEPVQ